MSVISDMLVQQIQKDGWLSVGNIMFKDGVPLFNPITTAGLICLSPGKRLMFSTSRMDSHNTYVIEESMLVQDMEHAGLQQTIAVVPLDDLHHFDYLLLSQWHRTNEDGTKFIGPKYPKPTDVEAMKPDPDTGLFPNTDTLTTIRGREMSAIATYPDENIKDYTGILVEGYQAFLKNQKMYCQFIKDVFGIGDCI